jgi:UDP-3-O-[3-hydroxymyristoyl] glucosamine N-acyltransferase
MPDPRFYRALSPQPLVDLAALAGAVLAAGEGAGIIIDGVAPLDWAGPTQIGFLSDAKYRGQLETSRAGACFVRAGQATPAGCVALIAARPQAAWALAANALHAVIEHPGGKDIDPTARFEEGVDIGQGVVVGPGTHIGRGTCLGAGCVIGPGVTIGRNSSIGPRAVVGFALIGNRVRLQAGAVIGEPGFGATAGDAGIMDIPQLGRVIIQDNVTIGANSCIDRGAFGDTTVGENTKIDNFVHIAHNVTLGRNCVLAAYTGISGSTVVGDGVQFGGKAGVADHLIIGNGAGIGAAASVFKDVPPGEVWTGFPARPIKRWMRETAWLARQAARRDSKDGDS